MAANRVSVTPLQIDLTHFDTAARVAADLVRRFQGTGSRTPWLLNVNVPDVGYAVLGPTEVTRLGKRHKAEPVIKTVSPRGETVYWVGAAGPAADSGTGTDFCAVAANRVSVTPLQIDLTPVDEQVAGPAWLNGTVRAPAVDPASGPR